MFEICINKTPCAIKHGTYKLFKNKISLGNDVSDDIFLEDEQGMVSHLELSLENNKLYITPSKETAYILVNNKRCTNKKIINIGDEFQFGKTSAKLVGFVPEAEYSKSEYLKKQIEKLKVENSPLLKTIDELIK